LKDDSSLNLFVSEMKTERRENLMAETNAENREIECPECRGFGSLGDGPFAMGTECPQCGGRGACDVSKATEETVRSVLDKASEQISLVVKEYLVLMLLVIIDGHDSTVKYGGDDEDGEHIEPSSLAALKVRAHLWGSFPSEIASRMTCDLYYTLGRQNELGWIEKGVPGYRFER
jgi:hypothetical protein